MNSSIAPHRYLDESRPKPVISSSSGILQLLLNHQFFSGPQKIEDRCRKFQNFDSLRSEPIHIYLQVVWPDVQIQPLRCKYAKMALFGHFESKINFRFSQRRDFSAAQKMNFFDFRHFRRNRKEGCENLCKLFRKVILKFLKYFRKERWQYKDIHFKGQNYVKNFD